MNDDNDWIFKKLPNWLRWILALPTGIIGCLIFPFIANFSIHTVLGWDVNNIFVQVGVMLASIGGFILGLFYCVPKYKAVISGISSILLAMYFAVLFVLWALNGYLWATENIINAISGIVCIYFAVKILLSKDEIDKSSVDEDNITF